MIFILVGYMASGKSTLGRVLAEKLIYNFLDLDDYIESQEQMSISEIFKTKGEIYFRKAETKYLKELLEGKTNLILSLGGGTPCYGNNMQLILDATNAKSLYLKASIPTLVNRLKNEKGKRPLVAHIKTDEELSEFIGKHLFERSPFYSQANIVLPTDNKTTSEIIDELLSKLF
ncbi:shikimate kinase [Aestuariibaculum suncheonense]|uniref:Shikimate kinase n=1 Tax=Aestuariibaculum suncheonense TaxID=1028745 RepID=A0A8J6QS03_9FLAO|nr:shikimate kinase [Aestuariibaculum suncheonense]MBD0834939.1 shikimate kinase [Aestuariibaculum suncheonense]